MSRSFECEIFVFTKMGVLEKNISLPLISGYICLTVTSLHLIDDYYPIGHYLKIKGNQSFNWTKWAKDSRQASESQSPCTEHSYVCV